MKVDPDLCPHVRKDDFQCARPPGHGAPTHIDRTGEMWPMHLPAVNPDRPRLRPDTEIVFVLPNGEETVMRVDTVTHGLVDGTHTALLVDKASYDRRTSSLFDRMP